MEQQLLIHRTPTTKGLGQTTTAGHLPHCHQPLAAEELFSQLRIVYVLNLSDVNIWHVLLSEGPGR